MKYLLNFGSLLSFLTAVILLFLESGCSTSHTRILPPRSPNYDKLTSLTLMELCNITYDSISQSGSRKDYEKIKQDIQKKILDSSLTRDFSLVWLALGDNNDNLTCVFRLNGGEKNTIVIIHRGTILSFINFEEDLNIIRQVQWRGTKDPRIKISAGMNEALDIVLSMKSAVFEGNTAQTSPVTLAQFIDNELRTYPATHLMIAGHSLGGAIATVHAINIVESRVNSLKMGTLGVKVYDFAGQTVGNNAFADYYQMFLDDRRLTFDHYRIVNKYDVIPYAFGQIGEVPNIQYPFTKSGLNDIRDLSAAIQTILGNKGYGHVGGVPVVLIPASPPSNCSNQVTNIRDFSCWALAEHQPDLYVQMLRTTLKY